MEQRKYSELSPYSLHIPPVTRDAVVQIIDRQFDWRTQSLFVQEGNPEVLHFRRTPLTSIPNNNIYFNKMDFEASQDLLVPTALSQESEWNIISKYNRPLNHLPETARALANRMEDFNIMEVPVGEAYYSYFGLFSRTPTVEQELSLSYKYNQGTTSVVLEHAVGGKDRTGKQLGETYLAVFRRDGEEFEYTLNPDGSFMRTFHRGSVRGRSFDASPKDIKRWGVSNLIMSEDADSITLDVMIKEFQMRMSLGRKLLPDWFQRMDNLDSPSVTGAQIVVDDLT